MTLVLRDAQDIAGLGFDNRFGDVGLGADGINGHNTAGKSKHFEQFGMVVISLGFSSTLRCPSTSSLSCAQALTL